MAVSGTLMALLVKLGVDASEFESGMDSAEGRSHSLKGTFESLATVGQGILVGAAAAAGSAALVIGKLGWEAVMAAGRFDQLVGVNEVLARNLNISNDTVRAASDSMRDQGIEAAIAEQTISRMMQANLDLAKATDIASVAQNAAVIAGENSSESVAAIIHGITTLNPLVLRRRGLVVDLNKAYKDLAESLGINQNQLTAANKQQAAFNAVMAAGARIEGAYDASMKNPIKQMGSMKRLINDIAVAAGGPLLKGFSSIITALSDVAKWFGTAVDEGGELRPFIEQAGQWFEGIGVKIGEFVKTAITNIPMFIDKLKVAVNWLKDHKGVVVAVLAAMGIAVMAFGVTVAAAVLTAMVPLLPAIAVMLAVAAIAFVVYKAWTSNWQGIQEKVAIIVAWIKTNVGSFLDKLKAAWEEWGPKIAAVFQNLWNKVVSIWETFMGIINPIVEAFRAAFSGDWYTFGEKLREAWDAVWVAVTEAVSNAWDSLKNAVAGLLTKVKTAFSEIDWKQVGKDIISGIARGISSAASWIKNAAVSAARAAWNAAKGFFGIRSGSKLFAEMGKNLMMGLAGGITAFSKIPVGVTVEATRDITRGATAAIPTGPVGGGGGMSGDRALALLQAIAEKEPLDEARLGRAVRDAVLQVTG